MTETERLVPRYPPRFSDIERVLVEWWDRPGGGATIIQEWGEWFADIGGRRFSISAQAMAIAQDLEGQQ